MKQAFTLLFLTTILYGWNGIVLDATTAKVIQNATISDSTHTVKSDLHGHFSIDTTENTLHIKAYGYRPLAIKQDQNMSYYRLTPIDIKALYLTFWGASNNSPRFKKSA